MLFTFPSRYLFSIGLSGVFSLTRWSWLIHTEFLVFRATQDTARITSLTCTRLSLSLACLSKQFHFTWIFILQSYNPDIAETISVWANPRSIATTRGITFVFFSSGYLDVSVLRVCLLSDTHCWVGCPIRKSTDQGLFAPHRSLSQLITSFFASESLGIRHTPLITSFCANKSIKLSSRNQSLFLYFWLLLLYYFQHVKELLKYTIMYLYVENIGVEPMTSCVQGRRSSQLS